ncbi:hypothetical protein FVEG_17365 [Fusarium verticillioides 7600]|uniref:Uncharacterized protein n=1 Tax=Gibberella moniliformis (strain M3125 / FGSC 7600) TaxID=334819 RepID=W7NEE7_GIBM7|nr:hypothetical protein FVEG_17365 [Fusarium verticillioides 7600]EWG54687.1 hypothetical protein FVEG_17365 [Fusarium verticillioides 7600]
MSKDAKHVIAVTTTAGHAQCPGRIDFPHAYDFCHFDDTQFRQVEPSTVVATWAPLSGYSTLPHVPDLKTQKHREEKEPKNISMREGRLSHRACLWE